MKRFNLVKAVGAVGILALMLTLPALSQATAPICTDFNDNDNHGFTACPDAPYVTILPPLAPGAGGFGYCLHAKDQYNVPPLLSELCAPTSYHGDWSIIAASGCGALSFCVRLLNDGNAAGTITYKPGVSIYRTLGTKTVRAVFRVTNPAYWITDNSGPRPWWVPICAPIDFEIGGVLPSNSYGYWEVMAPDGPGDWNWILEDVTKVGWSFDLWPSDDEELCLDNVSLRDNGCPFLIYVNKDIQNLGPDAYDFAVELSGKHPICWHYDGYPIGYPTPGWFSSFAYGPEGPNTKLHWQNFDDGTGGTIIQTGRTMHIGWGTNDYAPIKDMYWTDATGQKLLGSKVYNITTGWHYNQATKIFQLFWANPYNVDVQIANPVYAVFDTLIPLSVLNTENAALAAAFMPLPGGSEFTVPPGGQVTREIEVSRCGMFFVVRYEGTGQGCLDFVEVHIQGSTGAESNIPTLTEWGMIIMFVVMAGGIIWFVVRQRRRMATA